MTTKIMTDGVFPDELLTTWLQHVRDLDVAHPGCHFSISAESGTLTTEDVQSALDAVEPPFPVLGEAQVLLLCRGRRVLWLLL